VLAALGLPKAQQNDRSALTLLALAGIGPRGAWLEAAQPLLRTLDIMRFMRTEYRKTYAPNSRETIRRQTLHQFIEARVADLNPDDPKRPTNSGFNRYALSNAALGVIRSFGTGDFAAGAEAFGRAHGSLQEGYQSARTVHRVPVLLPDGTTIDLSAGEHNVLQKAIVEEFGPRFAPGAAVLYIGDTAKKHVVFDQSRLSELGVRITEHDKLPDIVMYRADQAWLFLIEAVTSHGPVSTVRMRQLRALVRDTQAGLIFVTAFLNRRQFKPYVADIAWETEVWIADDPDHLIHFNGHKFLGPYQTALTRG
jgi:adenine-specific DNA-methyltransferase